MRIAKVKMIDHQISKVDPTEKFLFELCDGNMIESVLMKYNYGNSVWLLVSGRRPHGMPGFCSLHHRRAGKKPGSFRDAQADISDSEDDGRAVSNVVVMGTGEPLDNYDNFVKFIHILSDEHGLHISQRNITASTCRHCYEYEEACG